jgi:hypothetical protein
MGIFRCNEVPDRGESVDRTALTQRILLVYSGVLTVVICVALLAGSTSRSKKVSFDEIDVKRINLTEPDGTLRLVIANQASFPGLIVKGKEYPHDRQTAGMLFFDDEGTENGGLIFGGRKDKDGKIESWGHLSFDQYQGDQVMVLEGGESDGQRYAGLQFVDQPDVPMNLVTDALRLPDDQRRARIREIFSGRNKAQSRIYLGKQPDHGAGLKLRDTEGRDRIVLKVAGDGIPSMQFLDDQGKVVAQFPKEAR